MNEELDKLVAFNIGCGVPDSPIIDYKLENCYMPNGKTYPLCNGQVGNVLCKDCNVYESES